MFINIGIVSDKYIFITKLKCRTIDLILPHEQYNPKEFGNDILVIKVSKPFDASPSVKQIKMAQFGFEPKGNFLPLFLIKTQNLKKSMCFLIFI